MNQLTSRRLLVLFLFLLALPALACDAIGLGPAATETPAATATPMASATPVATDTPAPTNTPVATSTPEPTATPEIGADFTTYESGALGVSVSYPGDWAIIDLFFLGIASDEQLLEDTTGVEDGAVIAIFAGESEEAPAGTSTEQLDEALADLEFEDATMVDGPTETEIQGQEATLATLEATADDGTALTLRLAVINSADRTGVVAGITPTSVAGEYLPTIDAVINSVQLFTPTEEDPFGDLLGGDGGVPAGEAIPFGPGQIAEGSLGEGGFQDYTFTGVAEAPLIVALQPEENFDIEMEIFPVGDESSLLADVDNGFSGEAEVLVFTPEADGEFFVRVSGFAGASGEYLITMFDPAEGLTLDGTVADNETVNVRVCVPAGEPVIAALIPAEDFDAVLSFSGAGGGLLTDEVDDGFSGEPEVVFYTGGVDSADDYPIIINLSGFAGGGGTYTLFIGPAGVVQDGC